MQIQHGPKEGFLFLLAGDQVEDVLVKPQTCTATADPIPILNPGKLKCTEREIRGVT